MSRTWTMRSAEVTSSSVARNAATSGVGNSETKPTVSERIALRPEGSGRRRIVGARVAMERAGALHGIELALQMGDAIGNEAAVDFELAFARAAEEAEAAALPFQMRPGTHQARALIGQRRELDLQRAFMRAGARAENLEDEAGAVDDLAF